MTYDEHTERGPARVTLHLSHGLQRFRLPASALHLRVLDGILLATARGAATTHRAGSELHVPAGTGVRLEPGTARVELELRCAPPGPERALEVLADPSTESSTRLACAADGGVELLLDPVRLPVSELGPDNVPVNLDLPAGLSHRPLTLDDAPGVLAAIVAEEVHDLGESTMTLEDVQADWLRPSYDIASSTVGVFDGDALVAYADLSTPSVAYSAVLPDYQGRGIGTALASWVQHKARLAGSDRVGTQVPEGSAADRLMRDLGYELLWTAWDLELPPDRDLAARPLPEGYVLSDATPEDHEAAWTLLEDAFLEWSDRERASLDDFGARIWGRPDAEPWNLRLVRDAGGDLVGATHVHLAGSDDSGGRSAYVAKIAVRPDHRGRGLAPAMLVDAFGAAREHGATRAYLSTDTRAGARALYERVGMVVTSTWVNRSIRL